MAKLNNKEIQDRIDLEMGNNGKVNPPPRDAHSKFRFEIEESIEDLVRDMKERPKKHYPQERIIDEKTGEVWFWDGGSKAPWRFVENKDPEEREAFGDYTLWDTDFRGCFASVRKKDEKLSITTALSGYKYEITPRRGGGSCVEFSGPVNGLLAQNLLPEMTYVPHTLKGKFVDKETGRDLTAYMDMQPYGELRALKNEQVIDGFWEYGEPGNEHDRYGFQVNERFNNEIPFFAESIDLKYTLQERKQYKAQRDFEEGVKTRDWDLELDGKKEEIRKRLAAVRGKLSGAVMADNVAEDKISGKDKRMATPQISVELAAEIRRRKATEK